MIELSTGYTTAGTPSPRRRYLQACRSGRAHGAGACGRGDASELAALLTQLGTLLGGSAAAEPPGGTQQAPSGYTPATNVPVGFNPSATIQGNTAA